MATTVVMETSLGIIQIELFDDETPLTVANFLNYVTDGDYVNSIVHRSVPGFVIQGGGFTYSSDGPYPVSVIPVIGIPADPPVVNEFNRSNTRGTIAMAKLSGDPNSATSQWFINLSDNSNLDDEAIGAFTVFGQVSASGMGVVDAIAALTIWNGGGPFNTIPLIDYSVSVPVSEQHLVITEITIDATGVDTDGDGFANESDNCPFDADETNINTDGDTLCNTNDPDDDNDGTLDSDDAFPLDPTETTDSDGDGLGNNTEAQLGTDPNNADTDGDGYSDKDEVDAETDPLSGDDSPAPSGLNIILIKAAMDAGNP